jgi:hypothetical protein
VRNQVGELVDHDERGPATGDAGQRLEGGVPGVERKATAGYAEMDTQRGSEAGERLHALLGHCLVVEPPRSGGEPTEQE